MEMDKTMEIGFPNLFLQYFNAMEEVRFPVRCRDHWINWITGSLVKVHWLAPRTLITPGNVHKVDKTQCLTSPTQSNASFYKN